MVEEELELDAISFAREESCDRLSFALRRQSLGWLQV